MRRRVSSFLDEVGKAAQLQCTSVYCVTNCKKRLQIMQMKQCKGLSLFSDHEMLCGSLKAQHLSQCFLRSQSAALQQCVGGVGASCVLRS